MNPRHGEFRRGTYIPIDPVQQQFLGRSAVFRELKAWLQQ